MSEGADIVIALTLAVQSTGGANAIFKLTSRLDRPVGVGPARTGSLVGIKPKNKGDAS